MGQSNATRIFFRLCAAVIIYTVAGSAHPGRGGLGINIPRIGRRIANDDPLAIGCEGFRNPAFCLERSTNVQLHEKTTFIGGNGTGVLAVVIFAMIDRADPVGLAASQECNRYG